MESISNRVKRIKEELIELIQLIDWSVDEDEKINYLKAIAETKQTVKKFKKTGIVITDDLKNQKIKYEKKLENAVDIINAKRTINQISKLLNSKVKSRKHHIPKKNKLISEFNTYNNTSNVFFSATSAKKKLRTKLGRMSSLEITNIINYIMNFKKDDKLIVLQGKIISNNDIHFEDRFRMTLTTSTKRILAALEIVEKQFTISDMLECVVIYSMKYLDTTQIKNK